MAYTHAALIQLGNSEVTQIMTRIMQNLIEGEILQIKDVIEAAADDGVTIRLNNIG